MTAAWACALAGTASQRLSNDAATTRARCNVVLVVISLPRGGKTGDCDSAPTVDSPAVVRVLLRVLLRDFLQPPATTKTSKPPRSRRRSIRAYGEEPGRLMPTGRINSEGMTKRHIECIGGPRDVVGRPGAWQAGRNVKPRPQCRKINSNTFTSVPRPVYIPSNDPRFQ